MFRVILSQIIHTPIIRRSAPARKEEIEQAIQQITRSFAACIRVSAPNFTPVANAVDTPGKAVGRIAFYPSPSLCSYTTSKRGEANY